MRNSTEIRIWMLRNQLTVDSTRRALGYWTARKKASLLMAN